MQNIEFTNKEKTKLLAEKNQKNNKMKIISINQPSNQQAQEKVKKLSEYLSLEWIEHLPDNPE